MGEIFAVEAFCLESHKVAWDFFHPSSQHDLETITGSRIILHVPSLEDLFKAGGLQRYRGLERGKLPCLWVEAALPEAAAETDAHFIVRLHNLSTDQIREVMNDLADAAQQASGFEDWKEGFETRRRHRHGPGPPAIPVPPPPPAAGAPGAVPANLPNAVPAPARGHNPVIQDGSGQKGDDPLGT